MKQEKLVAVIFAAVTMLAFAASAGAVDGTIEINQAVVNEGGSSPCGSTAGFPCTISASGSYRLTGNLTVPSGTNGINVNAGNVTIDLNGFAIIGPLTTLTSATPIGINAASDIPITVQNGMVNGFGTGVVLGFSGIARNIHADGNFNGIEAENSSVITGCTADNFNTGGTGIECQATCTITGNTANGDSLGGITCGAPGSGDACVISGNTVNDDGTGINCKGSGCLITGNTVSNTTICIESADATTGFGGNVLYGESVAFFRNATSLGSNLCTGASC
jgi:parallel beta-helix repeat protein